MNTAVSIPATCTGCTALSCPWHRGRSSRHRRDSGSHSNRATLVHLWMGLSPRGRPRCSRLAANRMSRISDTQSTLPGSAPCRSRPISWCSCRTTSCRWCLSTCLRCISHTYSRWSGTPFPSRSSSHRLPTPRQGSCPPRWGRLWHRSPPCCPYRHSPRRSACLRSIR